MELNLTERNSRRLTALVETGGVASPEEFIEWALRICEAENAFVERNRAALHNAIDVAEEAPVYELDKAQWTSIRSDVAKRLDG